MAKLAGKAVQTSAVQTSVRPPPPVPAVLSCRGGKLDRPPCGTGSALNAPFRSRNARFKFKRQNRLPSPTNANNFDHLRWFDLRLAGTFDWRGDGGNRTRGNLPRNKGFWGRDVAPCGILWRQLDPGVQLKTGVERPSKTRGPMR
jgi:hypothetical protein